MAELEDYEDELEMDEMEAEPVEAPKKEMTRRPVQAAPQAQAPKQKVKETLKERYTAIHQPERIVIVDNKNETIVADGFKDIGTASVSALMLNNQDKILISLGA
jgi:hypothetical protein